MGHQIPLNHIFTIPFAAHEQHGDATHHAHCACHHHRTSCNNCGRQRAPAHGSHHIAATMAREPRGTPLLLAMSIDSKTLVAADSLHMISIFAIDSSAERLTLAGIRKASSKITALAITEGGHTVLFAEECAPATLKMFNTSKPAALCEVSPVHKNEKARVISCSISSHFILASFYSERTAKTTMALWGRAHNKIDSELTHVFTWQSEHTASACKHLYYPIYVTEWHRRGDHSKYYAEVAYYVDNQLVLHPQVGNEACASSCISLNRKPISIRIDQTHGRDCVYVLSNDQLRIYRVDRRNHLRETDSVVLGDGVCSSAVCGIWQGEMNRHVTVARIVNGQVMVFRAQLPSKIRFQLA